MQKTSIWKRLSKFLAVLLCVSMVLQYAVPMAQATTDTEVETSGESSIINPNSLIEIIDFDDGPGADDAPIAPMTVRDGSPTIVLDGEDYVLQLPSGARAQYSQSVSNTVLTAGNYKLTGYVKLGDGKAASVSTTIWAYKNTPTSNTVAPTLENHIVGSADANGWSYFEIPFTLGDKYTLVQFILKNSNSGDVWFDDLQYCRMTAYESWMYDSGIWEANSMMVSKFPDLSQDAPDVWNELAELTFETEQAVTQRQGTISVIDDTTREGSTKVLQVGANSRAQYSLTLGSKLPAGYCRISGYVKLGDVDLSKVSLTIWAYSNPINNGNTYGPNIADCLIGSADANGWTYFEVDFQHGVSFGTVQFILNNYDTANEILFDDVVYAQYTGEGVPPATGTTEGMGENLLTNGDFAVTDAAVDGFAWTSNNTTTTVTTADGYLRSEYNSTDYRVISTLTQNNVAVEPGAVYQVKFNYRITESNEPDATWYGPYVQLSNSDKFLRIRASDAETGLNTSGEWTEFAYTFIMPDGGSSLKFTINSWLYENDWCEVDDIALCKIADAASIKLELADRFFYLDEAKTTFTATLRDTSKAAETVTFTVYNGKDVLWTKDATFANNAAQVEFDFSALTLKTDGTPYVVMATLGDTVVTEEIFFSPRPATLDADGNFVKDGEIVKVNIAWAIDRNEIKEGVVTDYEKVAEIGANVMALGSIKSVEQALQMLDYCDSFGYLGFLQMNWGLYNKDIETKTKTLIEVVSDERIQNHPALLGYCLTDEPWSWGAEDQVAENLADGYRLIRRFDKKNVIFSINNMEQYHGLTTHYSDVLVVDHYEAPAGGKVYTKVLKAVEAADAAEMPVWAVVGAYKQDDYFPTADQVRNEVWQALLAGADGLGYYSISYGGGYNASGNGVAIWEYMDAEGNLKTIYTSAYSLTINQQ